MYFIRISNGRNRFKDRKTFFGRIIQSGAGGGILEEERGFLSFGNLFRNPKSTKNPPTLRDRRPNDKKGHGEQRGEREVHDFTWLSF